jgi:hypothetical protein
MRALVLVAALPAVPGCLIPQHVQVDPPGNFPPAITDLIARPATYHPIGSHIDRSDLETGDAGVATELTLEVLVRDPDVDQQLAYQVWINYPVPPNSATGNTRLVPDEAGDSDRATRNLRVSLSLADIPTTGCARVELFVTSEFDPFSRDREPVTDGDLATATWWVVADGTVPISSCPEAP